MINRDLAALDALGQLESEIRTIEVLTRRLAAVPMWEPSHRLGRQAAEALAMIEQMKARMSRRLVVTIIGPSGAGKSTLLNALAGVDDLSPSGRQRPTTQELVVLANDNEAVHQLLGPLEESRIRIHSSQAAEALSHMILVDTPDTDSTLRDEHLPLIQHMVARSDVLLCVFDAQNPKRRDHADFMAPIIQQFHGNSLVAVVNQCDRQDAEELTRTIGPEFERYLQEAWDTKPQALLLISARSHLQRPAWDPNAGPRHNLDQFDQLKQMIFETFSRPGFGPDRRTANARQLRTYLVEQVNSAVEQDREGLEEALTQIAGAEKTALQQAAAGLRADDQRMILGVHARLYQELAQRWMGPVGWMVAIWARLIMFGSGLAALVRFGNPLSQIWGLVSSWRRYKESSGAIAALNNQSRINSARQAFLNSWLTLWPDIAERLVRARFNPDVRRMDPEQEAPVGDLVRDLWRDALDAEIDRSATTLSHAALQTLFNLPCLALLVYLGWLTTTRFLTGSYLAGDFFLHALLTIAVVLLLSFFLLQMLVRLAVGRDRIQQRAFQSVERAIGQTPVVTGRQVSDQVELVLSLTG